MPYQSIKSTQLSALLSPNNTVYTPIPFGAYLLVYTPALGFLANYDGTATAYPHRALAFDALTLGNGMVRLFSSQGNPAFLDFVHIRINEDSDYIPTSIAGTPTAFQVTRNVASFTSAQLNSTPTVYVSTHPGIDDYAYPVSLGVGILEAMQDINAMVTPAPVVLYYESATNTYAAFMTVTLVNIP